MHQPNNYTPCSPEGSPSKTIKASMAANAAAAAFSSGASLFDPWKLHESTKQEFKERLDLMTYDHYTLCRAAEFISISNSIGSSSVNCIYPRGWCIGVLLSEFVNNTDRWHLSAQNASQLIQRICKDHGPAVFQKLNALHLLDAHDFRLELSMDEDHEKQRIRATQQIFFPQVLHPVNNTKTTCIPLFMLPLFLYKLLSNQRQPRGPMDNRPEIAATLGGSAMKAFGSSFGDVHHIIMTCLTESISLCCTGGNGGGNNNDNVASASDEIVSQGSLVAADAAVLPLASAETAMGSPEPEDDETALTRTISGGFEHLKYCGDVARAFPNSQKPPIHHYIDYPQEKTILAMLSNGIKKRNLNAVLHCVKLEQRVRNLLFLYRSMLPQFLVYYIEDLSNKPIPAPASLVAPSSSMLGRRASLSSLTGSPEKPRCTTNNHSSSSSLKHKRELPEDIEDDDDKKRRGSSSSPKRIRTSLPVSRRLDFASVAAAAAVATATILDSTSPPSSSSSPAKASTTLTNDTPAHIE